jgi:hypothetical protein
MCAITKGKNPFAVCNIYNNNNNNLEMTVTNPNVTQEEDMRFNSGNAYDHLVQNLLSFRLLLTDIKIRIYKILLLPGALYGCEI